MHYPPDMDLPWLKSISILCIFIAFIIWFTRDIPTDTNQQSYPSSASSPTWTEHERNLTPLEQATMSADFIREFNDATATTMSPSPTSIVSLGTGDSTPPTVTIQSPAEQGVITATSVCFPLWVSDDTTPWQQLTVRVRLDGNGWSDWSNQLSYCYDDLINGLHRFSVQIRDPNGNSSGDITRSFTVMH